MSLKVFLPVQVEYKPTTVVLLPMRATTLVSKISKRSQKKKNNNK